MQWGDWRCFWKKNTVAERISRFHLARNLIRPLESTHIFTQSGWLILFNPDYLSGQHKLGKSTKHFLFVELLRSVQTSYCLLFNSSSSSSSSIAPPWRKQSDLWTLASISLRPRAPSWIWIRWIQYATHRNNFTSPQNWLCRLRCKIPLRHLATSSLGNIFWRHSCFSPKQPEPQTHGDFNVSLFKRQTQLLLLLWRTYLSRTSNNALT